MKTLLELLGQEMYDQVMTKLGDVQVFLHKKDEKVIVDDGKLIPQYRLQEVTDQKKLIQDQLDKAEKDLKDLKKLATGNEELTQKITALQDENKTIKEETVKAELQLKKSLAVKEGLMNAGVVDAEARELLLHKFDLATIELDEKGTVKEFDSKLKPIKENKTFLKLFGETKVVGKDFKEGDNPEGLLTPDQVKAMSQADVTKSYDLVQKSMASWNKTDVTN